MPATPAKPARPAPRRRPSPAQSGLPDPRPVTGYAVAVSDGGTEVTITLDQPCIVRTPAWAFIDCDNGGRVYAASVSIQDNRTFVFLFPGGLPDSVGIVEVPYQDMQVQNPQGGFVQPGGKWFRKPK